MAELSLAQKKAIALASARARAAQAQQGAPPDNLGDQSTLQPQQSDNQALRASLPMPDAPDPQAIANAQKPKLNFGPSSGATMNPLPAISAFGDQMAGHIPIVGPQLQTWRDQANAAVNGGTPQQARADVEQMTAANPEAATAGAATGAVAPYAVAGEIPLMAGALGFEGPLLTRLGMTGASQYAINTGDNLAHGQQLPQAAGNAAMSAAGSLPFALFGGAGAKGADSARTDAVNTLKREGVQLTAGQQKASRPLMMAESQLGGAAIQTFRDKQLGQFTKAALKTAGVTADSAAPAVMDKAYDTIGTKFNSLAMMTKIKADSQLQNDLLKAATDYTDLTGKSVPIIENVVNQVGAIAGKNGGIIPGDSYRALNTQLAASIKRASDPDVRSALIEIKEAMDEAVSRSMSGKTLAAWQTVRRQYANLMRITDAVAGAGQFAAQGLLTPEALSQAVRTNTTRRSYVRGSGDLNELARAGVIAMPQLADSGTASRAFPLMLASSAGSAAMTHAATGGNLAATLAAASAPAVGAGVAGVVGRAMLSPAGRHLLTKGTKIPAATARGLLPQLMPPNSGQ